VQIGTRNKRNIERENGKMIYNFKLSFITLTIHSPNKIITAKDGHKNCLEPFLQWARRQYGLNTYLWKAEHQKRGQLHYHITSTSYIPMKEIQKKWNELQARNGYLDHYYRKKGHYNAPSTKINKVWRENDLAGYMTKEFAKCYQNEKSVGGKVWDCSKNLKCGDYYTLETDGLTNRNYLPVINAMARAGTVRSIVHEKCIIHKFNFQAIDILSFEDKKEYCEYLKDIENDNLIRIRPPKKVISFAPLDKGTKTNFPIQLNLFSSS
jgi:hypothetical protein